MQVWTDHEAATYVQCRMHTTSTLPVASHRLLLHLSSHKGCKHNTVSKYSEKFIRRDMPSINPTMIRKAYEKRCLPGITKDVSSLNMTNRAHLQAHEWRLALLSATLVRFPPANCTAPPTHHRCAALYCTQCTAVQCTKHLPLSISHFGSIRTCGHV